MTDQKNKASDTQYGLIKDLSTKKGFEGRNYIRIAIRDEKDNEKLVAALKKKLN